MASLAQLSYIVALDTYRHFVTASAKSFVTQPTLSMQIKKLEEELDVVIFDRSKQPVIPTEIGKKIIAQARLVLAEYNRIEAIIQEEKSIVSGVLTVAIIPTLAPYLLPLFIGNFSKKFPKLQIKVIELLTEEIIDHLEKDLVDVGILVTPLEEAGIVEQPLFYEKMLIYAHPEHPFVQKEKITTVEIASPDIWLLTEGHCFRSQVVNLCAYQTDAQEISGLVYESGSIETLRKLVDQEGGFTLIPELALNDITKVNQIKEFSQSTPLREVSLVYSRHYAKEQLIRLLAQEIQSSVPKEMLDRSRGSVVSWR
ncbi:MAG TPA: hydrogen peroxide-inducible genes activator [Saprospiraceae bacterium]|nr:hydrogen peroxide-inducible genes activator [Saprospiraceae bacterium]